MDTEHHKKIKLVKDGQDQFLFYENDNMKLEKKLNDEEYHGLFEKLQPNFTFSLPDRLVQDFIKDGSIMPSFKNSSQFTKEDFNDMLEQIKDKPKRRENRKRKYLKNKTKRKERKNKSETKRKLMEKVTKKPMKKKQERKKTNKNKHTY
jgi:hypothetical protein